MAFSGDLADYPLPELLFFLSSKNRSGWLTLRNEQSEITFTLLHGRPIAAQSSDDEQRLGQRLVADGALSRAQLRRALARQRRGLPAPALGELLVELGHVTPQLVRHALHEQICELIFQLLIRPSGRFDYTRGLPDMRGVEVDVTMEREVLAAIGRADEWFTSQIPLARLRVEADITPDMLVGAVEADWPVFEALRAGGDSVDQLAVGSGWSRAAVIAAVSRLQALGLLRVEPRGGRAVAGSALFAAD